MPVTQSATYAWQNYPRNTFKNSCLPQQNGHAFRFFLIFRLLGFPCLLLETSVRITLWTSISLKSGNYFVSGSTALTLSFSFSNCLIFRLTSCVYGLLAGQDIVSIITLSLCALAYIWRMFSVINWVSYVVLRYFDKRLVRMNHNGGSHNSVPRIIVFFFHFPTHKYQTHVYRTLKLLLW